MITWKDSSPRWTIKGLYTCAERDVKLLTHLFRFKILQTLLCDATAIKAVITIAIRLRYDYDPTTTYRARLLPFDAIRREQKMNMTIFRRSRVVVVS